MQKCNIDDYDDIMQLQEDVINNMSKTEWFCPSTDDEIKTALKNPNDYLCVKVLDENRVIAFSYVILNPTGSADLHKDLVDNNLIDEIKRYSTFETVFVSPEYRGYGIQSMLIDMLCDWVKKMGKCSICATVHPENIYSQNNFEKSGFTLANPEPLPKYGGIRNYFLKNL